MHCLPQTRRPNVARRRAKGGLHVADNFRPFPWEFAGASGGGLRLEKRDARLGLEIISGGVLERIIQGRKVKLNVVVRLT